MQKNKKNPLSRFWEKCVSNQPTNQPIITNNTDLIGLRWSRSNKKYKHCIEFINSKIYIMTKIKVQLNMYILQLCESSNNVTFKP